MRRLTPILTASFLAILAVGAARADSEMLNIPSRDPEMTREQIERLYRLEQAFLVCDHVRVSGHELKRLDDVIAEFETRTSIPVDELESIYEQVEKAAAENVSGFCANMPEANAEIRDVSLAGLD